MENNDVLWLEAQVRLLNETIRQTLEYQAPTSNAVKVLTRMRDRYVRIAEVLNKP